MATNSLGEIFSGICFHGFLTIGGDSDADVSERISSNEAAAAATKMENPSV